MLFFGSFLRFFSQKISKIKLDAENSVEIMAPQGCQLSVRKLLPLAHQDTIQALARNSSTDLCPSEFFQLCLRVVYALNLAHDLGGEVCVSTIRTNELTNLQVSLEGSLVDRLTLSVTPIARFRRKASTNDLEPKMRASPLTGTLALHFVSKRQGRGQRAL